MQKLIDGFQYFKHHVFPRERQLFRDLGSKQQPQALFITCADSRVVPTLITQSRPGDLFVCRTIGNQVPAHCVAADAGVASAVEYAVEVLGVQDVVICGHSDCGAMKAVLHPEKTAALPATKAWLKNTGNLRFSVLSNYPDASDDVLLHVITEENIIAQLRNLTTHPSVAGRLQRKEIRIHGWLYHIHSGQITCYDSSSSGFRPLSSYSAPPVSTPELQRVSEGGAA